MAAANGAAPPRPPPRAWSPRRARRASRSPRVDPRRRPGTRREKSPTEARRRPSARTPQPRVAPCRAPPSPPTSARRPSRTPPRSSPRPRRRRRPRRVASRGRRGTNIPPSVDARARTIPNDDTDDRARPPRVPTPRTPREGRRRRPFGARARARASRRRGFAETRPGTSARRTAPPRRRRGGRRGGRGGDGSRGRCGEDVHESRDECGGRGGSRRCARGGAAEEVEDVGVHLEGELGIRGGVRVRKTSRLEQAEERLHRALALAEVDPAGGAEAIVGGRAALDGGHEQLHACSLVQIQGVAAERRGGRRRAGGGTSGGGSRRGGGGERGEKSAREGACRASAGGDPEGGPGSASGSDDRARGGLKKGGTAGRRAERADPREGGPLARATPRRATIDARRGDRAIASSARRTSVSERYPRPAHRGGRSARLEPPPSSRARPRDPRLCAAGTPGGSPGPRVRPSGTREPPPAPCPTGRPRRRAAAPRAAAPGTPASPPSFHRQGGRVAATRVEDVNRTGRAREGKNTRGARRVPASRRNRTETESSKKYEMKSTVILVRRFGKFEEEIEHRPSRFQDPNKNLHRRVLLSLSRPRETPPQRPRK